MVTHVDGQKQMIQNAKDHKNRAWLTNPSMTQSVASLEDKPRSSSPGVRHLNRRAGGALLERLQSETLNYSGQSVSKMNAMDQASQNNCGEEQAAGPEEISRIRSVERARAKFLSKTTSRSFVSPTRPRPNSETISRTQSSEGVEEHPPSTYVAEAEAVFALSNVGTVAMAGRCQDSIVGQPIHRLRRSESTHIKLGIVPTSAGGGALGRELASIVSPGRAAGAAAAIRRARATVERLSSEIEPHSTFAHGNSRPAVGEDSESSGSAQPLVPAGRPHHSSVRAPLEDARRAAAAAAAAAAPAGVIDAPVARTRPPRSSKSPQREPAGRQPADSALRGSAAATENDQDDLAAHTAIPSAATRRPTSPARPGISPARISHRPPSDDPEPSAGGRAGDQPLNAAAAGTNVAAAGADCGGGGRRPISAAYRPPARPRSPSEVPRAGAGHGLPELRRPASASQHGSSGPAAAAAGAGSGDGAPRRASSANSDSPTPHLVSSGGGGGLGSEPGGEEASARAGDAEDPSTAAAWSGPGEVGARAATRTNRAEGSGRESEEEVKAEASE